MAPDRAQRDRRQNNSENNANCFHKVLPWSALSSECGLHIKHLREIGLHDVCDVKITFRGWVDIIGR